MTRTVLITGASGSLGLTISRHLWQLGYQVAMADIAIDAAGEGARQIDAEGSACCPWRWISANPNTFTLRWRRSTNDLAGWMCWLTTRRSR